MATLQILSPPETPGTKSFVTSKSRKAGYKRIRFKNWQPEPAKQSPEPKKSPKHTRPTDEASSPVTSTDTDSDIDSILRAVLPTQCSPFQRLPMNGTRVDPFTDLPIKAEGVVPATLDYFLSICAPDSKDGFVIEGHPNPHMSMLFPFMLENSILFESVIALCRASILLCVGKPVGEDKPLIYHRTRVIKGVSTALGTDDATSDSVLLTVAMLLTLEYLIGNLSAVGAHRAGLQRMISLRSDLDDSTPWKIFVKAGLDAYKSLGSFVTGEPPDISSDSHGFIHETFAGLSLDRPIEYPALPFSPELCTTLSRLPPGFIEFCLSGRLSTQTMQVLASLHATTVFTKSDGFDSTRLDAELQAMLSALQRLSLMRISTIEKYLTCGLVGYSFHLRNLRPLNLFHDPPLQAFIKLVPNQEKPDSEREQRVMIWITMVVAGALNLRTIRMPGTHLILDRLFYLYPKMSNWDALEEILRSFFWTKPILEHWKKCHREGLLRWKQVSRMDDSPSLLDLEGLSVKAADAQDDIKEISFEQIQQHARDSPKEMMDMMRAARCPFQARMRMLGVDTEGMASPHG